MTGSIGARTSRSARLLPRLRQLLPPGTLAVGAGLLVLGASSYGFLAVCARAVGPVRFAALSVLWVLVYTAGPGLFLPLEQETARAVAARRAHSVGGRPVLLRAAALGGGLLVVLCAIVGALHRPLLGALFDSDGALLAALLLSIVGAAVASLFRGVLAGTGQFGRYGGQLALEGGLRMVASAVLAVAAVRAVGPYGLWIGLAPLLAVLVLAVRMSPVALDPGPPASWTEMSGALGLLLVASLLSQALVNAGPVLVKLLATPDERGLAGQFLAGLIVARVPLFLFAAVQAVLLPGLAALASAGRHRDFRARLRRITTLVTAIGFVGSVGAFAVGPLIVSTFFGAAFGLGRLDLLYLAVASSGYMLAVVWAQGLIALRGHALAALGWLSGILVHLAVTVPMRGLLPRVEIGFLAGTMIAAAVMAALLIGRAANVGVERGPVIGARPATVAPER